MAGFDENESTTDVEGRSPANQTKDPEEFEQDTMVDDMADGLANLSTDTGARVAPGDDDDQETEPLKSLDELRADLASQAQASGTPQRPVMKNR